MSQLRKVRLRHFSPMRLGITLGVLQGLLSTVFIPVVFFAGAAAAYLQHTIPGVPWVFVGAGIFFMPLANALAGFLGGVLIATAYNFVARWTGGVEYIIEEVS